MISGIVQKLGQYNIFRNYSKIIEKGGGEEKGRNGRTTPPITY